MVEKKADVTIGSEVGPNTPLKRNKQSVMSVRLYKQLLIFLTALSLGACHQAVTPDYPNERGELLANLNPTVASASFSQLVDWSPDGNELYYLLLVNGTYELHALSIPSRTVRLIARDDRWRQILTGNSAAVLSRDGQFIYLIARQIQTAIEPFALYQVDTHGQNQIARLDIGSPDFSSASLVLSPDGSRLSFRYRYDSIRVHTLAAKTSIRLQAQGALAFSPDASRLLLNQGNGTVYRNVSLTDFSSADVDIRTPTASPSFSRGDVLWQSEGIRYVYGDFNPDPGKPAESSPFALFLWNVIQQKSTLIRPDLQEEFPVQSSMVTWSRNGQRIVYPTTNSSQSLKGSVNQIIYTTNMTTLQTQKIATVTLEEDEKTQSFGRMLLAPDGSKMVYSIGSKLYSVSIQP